MISRNTALRALLAVVCLAAAQLVASRAQPPLRVAVAEQARTVFVGTSGGALLQGDGDATWRVRQTVDGGVTALAAAGDGHTLYAGTNGSMWRSTDRGRFWQLTNGGALGNTMVTALAVNPRDPDVVYAATGDNLYQTTDGGASWIRLLNDLPSGAVSSVVLDPLNPASVWAGTGGQGLIHSSDGGSTWSATYDSALLSSSSVTAVAVSPASSAVIYAGTTSGLYQSTDGGSTWVALDNGLSGSANIASLAISPRQPSLVYAGTDSGAYYSTDGGSTWSAADSLPQGLVSVIVADPASARQAYAGTVQGLYTTRDGGASWAHIAGGDLGYGADVRSLTLTTAQRLPTDATPAVGHGARYFTQTSHNLGGAFLSFWQRYGGLDTFGYPRSEAYSEGGRVVQYTDRFRLEFSGGRVVTAPLGRVLTAGRSFPRVEPIPSTRDRIYVASTGHSLTGRFLTYWRNHNGATLLGAPICEPVREGNDDGTGRVYLTQWFERGRLEYHAELAGTRYEVQLGLVGKQDLRRRGWL